MRAGEALQSPARSRADPRAAACGEHGEHGEDGACAWGLWRGRRPLSCGAALPGRLGASAPVVLSLPISPGRAAGIEPLKAPEGQAPLAGRSLDTCGPP